MIGNMMIVRAVLLSLIRVVYAKSIASTTKTITLGVSGVMPKWVNRYSTPISTILVFSMIPPSTYAPQLNISMCQGISAWFQFITPRRRSPEKAGISTNVAPHMATTSARTPCRLSVAQRPSTARNTTAERFSSAVIGPSSL